MKNSKNFFCFLLIYFFCFPVSGAKEIHHYVFFNRDRDRIEDQVFLETRAFVGAQLKYTWRELEPEEDQYNFGFIQSDLNFLTQNGKRLFLQIQDVSFDMSIINVPGYLLNDKKYNGGIAKQYQYQGDDEQNAVPEGWVARRWDPAVRERFHKLLDALGRQFDGKIEGINIPETTVSFGESGRLFPQGFGFDIYRDAVIENMKACHEVIPTGIAVQWGNYEHINPRTNRQITISELIEFAGEYLKVGYIFWCMQEPYFSEKLIPFLKKYSINVNWKKRWLTKNIKCDWACFQREWILKYFSVIYYSGG